jgi:hypothetical protein
MADDNEKKNDEMDSSAKDESTDDTNKTGRSWMSCR